MKRALITGIAGQDGSYLAEFLLSKGYEVHGIVRRVAIDQEERLRRIRHIADRITLHSASLESYPALFEVVRKVQPDEVYHLAAQSFVQYSFQDEFSTMNTNVNGTHYLLASVRELCPQARFYFAGTSEMYGNSPAPQCEDTPLVPRSSYGISKLAGYHMTRLYREAYGMFTATGILFNHESPRRGLEFVTRKVTRAAAKIALGRQDVLTLGNLDAQRDWGFAGDYVEAMWAMLQQERPDDFVVATGKTQSVGELVEAAFKRVGLNWQKHVKIDEKYMRPAEIHVLLGDPSKAKAQLGWEPKVNFEGLVAMMVDADLADLQTPRE